MATQLVEQFMDMHTRLADLSARLSALRYMFEAAKELSSTDKTGFRSFLQECQDEAETLTKILGNTTIDKLWR